MKFIKKNFLMIIALLLGVAGIAFMFTDCATLESSSPKMQELINNLVGKDSLMKVSAFEMIFGLTETYTLLGFSAETQYLAFSIVNLLALVCAVLAILSVIFAPVNKKSAVISAILFIAAAVLSFLMPSMIAAGKDFVSNDSALLVAKALPCMYVVAAVFLFAALVALAIACVGGGKKGKKRRK